MADFFKKIIFSLQKPLLILVMGEKRSGVGDFVFKILKEKNKIRKFTARPPFWVKKNEILVFLADINDPSKLEEIKSLLKIVPLSLMVISSLGEGAVDNNQEKQAFLEKASGIAGSLKENDYAVINFEEGVVRKIKSRTEARILSYGFEDGADFKASDMNISGDKTNFKVNHEGDIVPFWLENVSNKEEVYNVLAAITVAAITNLNLVEISELLKS